MNKEDIKVLFKTILYSMILLFIGMIIGGIIS